MAPWLKFEKARAVPATSKALYCLLGDHQWAATMVAMGKKMAFTLYVGLPLTYPHSGEDGSDEQEEPG